MNNTLQETVKPRNGLRLSLLAVAFAFLVIGLGAFTRLVDAGLGCPDWPTCYGHILWPQTSEEIQQANQAFPELPVIAGKPWPEMVHRYVAATLGFLVIALCIQVYKKQQSGQPRKLSWLLLVIIILQGLFGMWTVTLKLWPQVVTIHLLGGFTTLSLLWLLSLRLQNKNWLLLLEQWQQLAGIRSLAWLGLALVVLQVALGGWMTANYAAVACPDLPTCQGQLWPTMDIVSGFNFMQQVGPNYLGGILDNDARIAIHVSHRLGAALVTALLLLLCWQMYFRLPLLQLQRLAKILFTVLLLQLLLGLANIVFHFPLAVAVAHNLGAALLLLTMLSINYRLNTAQLIDSERSVSDGNISS